MLTRTFASLVVGLFYLTGCSTEPKPSGSEIEQALVARLPAFARVSSFSVEAMQNMGTKVEPLWHARFRSTVEVTSPTFTSDGADPGVTFVRVVKQKGESTQVFGKSVSTLYGGAWRTALEFEGQPLEAMGRPEGAFGSAKVIVRGSKEESAYVVEQAEKQRLAGIAAQREAAEQQLAAERANIERRRALADASKTIVGTWRNQFGVVAIHADGSYQITYEDSRQIVEGGTWKMTPTFTQLLRLHAYPLVGETGCIWSFNFEL